MSLQGTLDTFALQDVLRLLASSSKTGHLRITGSRGTGGVWVKDGKVVGASSDAAGAKASPAEVTFDLLRFDEGAFVFDTGATALDPDEPTEIAPMLETAEQLLEDWKAIEAVVPSLGHHVSLAADLPSDTVSVDRDRWKVIVALGAGGTVGVLGERMEMGELAVSRAVKDLVEAGLVTIEDRGDVWPPAAAAPARSTGEVPAVASADVSDANEADAEPVAQEPAARTERPESGGVRRLDPNERPPARRPGRPGDAAAASFPGRPTRENPAMPGRAGAGRPTGAQPALGGRPTGGQPAAGGRPAASGRPGADRGPAGGGRPTGDRSSSDRPTGERTDSRQAGTGGGQPAGRPGLPPLGGKANPAANIEDPELARQLADLGPVAAAAVVAAADAETPEEREAALEGIQGEDGEPLNRGMLLKFLSSVRT